MENNVNHHWITSEFPRRIDLRSSIGIYLGSPLASRGNIRVGSISRKEDIALPAMYFWIARVELFKYLTVVLGPCLLDMTNMYLVNIWSCLRRRVTFTVRGKTAYTIRHPKPLTSAGNSCELPSETIGSDTLLSLKLFRIEMNFVYFIYKFIRFFWAFRLEN